LQQVSFFRSSLTIIKKKIPFLIYFIFIFFFRLNISLDASQTSTSSRSPGRTPAGRGQKRRRVDIAEAVEEFSQQSSSSGFQRQASAKGGVDIDEVDADGKFIKLKNTTSKVMIIILFIKVNLPADST
jgi:hypothetical protein